MGEVSFVEDGDFFSGMDCFVGGEAFCLGVEGPNRPKPCVKNANKITIHSEIYLNFEKERECGVAATLMYPLPEARGGID